MLRTQTLRFADDGDIPNHPRWPMIVYIQALEANSRDPAVSFERCFESNGWGDGWRNGIFPFPHYHSNAHEVLGIAAGRATVQFGGAAGSAIDVAVGDAVLLPAGTGHQLLSASPDLLVIGAYPPGPRRDLMRSGARDRAAIRHRIAAVAKPDSDPIAGADGPMKLLWA
jgi:uncharacterized protein YjlB